MTLNALIIGDTGGIGAAMSQRFTGAGWSVRGVSRSQDGLDFTNPDQTDRILSEILGQFQVVLVATGALYGAGAPPEKSLRHLRNDAMMEQMQINAIGPAMVLRHAARLMPKRERTVFAALSARVGSIGDNALGGWYSYRAAKAALNQIVHTGAIEMQRSHPRSVCVTLHPGTVATTFTENYQQRHAVVTPDHAAHQLFDVIEGLSPDETGRFLDCRGRQIDW